MKWTAEQVAVFAATGDLKINAVAGSGKTTTLMELAAQAADQGQRVTYIAFNKKVKEEAAVKAVERGLSARDFQAVTAHGLAYRHLQAVSDGGRRSRRRTTNPPPCCLTSPAGGSVHKTGSLWRHTRDTSFGCSATRRPGRWPS